jgi:hypothetical protein
MFLTRDKFIPIPKDPAKDPTALSVYLKPGVPIRLFKGSLLGYDSTKDSALYTVAGNKNATDLYVYENGISRNLKLSAASFSSGKIVHDETDDNLKQHIYTVERSTTLNKTILSSITEEKGSQVKKPLLQIDVNTSLPFNVDSEGNIVYVKPNNQIILRSKFGDDKSEKVVTTLDVAISVKKIAYSRFDNLIIFLADVAPSFGNTPSRMLYRIDTKKPKNLGAIDVNVTDFVLQINGQKTFYSKTIITGFDHVYEYDHTNSKRTFQLEDHIQTFNVTPTGNTIVYATKITEGKPNQSIWLVNPTTQLKTQLLQSSKLVGQIYWMKSERSILYTDNSKQSEGDTTTSNVTYQLDIELSIERNGDEDES